MVIPDNITDSLEDKYLDLRGLSSYSALGVGTLRDYLKTGGLPSFRLRGKILIKKSEFDLWMEGYRVKKKQNINDIADEVLTSLKCQQSK